MKKITSILLVMITCLLCFSCSLDGKFKNTTWGATKQYGIYNEETKAFDYYNAVVELKLNADGSGTFKITPEKTTEKYFAINLEIMYVIKEIKNESKGYFEDWLIATDGENILEFKIVETLNPQPTHYVLELDDATYGSVDLLEK